MQVGLAQPITFGKENSQGEGNGKLIVKGGTRLQGTIPVSGCKNAVLPIAVAAAILGDGVSVLHNVPNLTDVKTLSAVLEGLGATTKIKKSSLYIEPINHLQYEAPYELVRKMRASIYVLGPLVAKLGKAKVSFPGGCAIGPRPIDLHIRGLEHLGAEVTGRKRIHLRASGTSRGYRDVPHGTVRTQCRCHCECYDGCHFG